MMNQRNNPMFMVQQFNNFRNNFHGDPEQEVRKLLASGQLNQNQLNQLQSMATEFMKLLNTK